jgi:hypothetical protein
MSAHPNDSCTAWDIKYYGLQKFPLASLSKRGNESNMKYLILLLLILAVWALVVEFLLKDRRSEGLGTFTDKLKDLGLRLHWAVGALAIIALFVYVTRFIYRLFWGE